MKYRKYGNTDLEVSEICFGTMRYAPKTEVHNEQSAQAARALEEAVDCGINFIHSSYEYQTRWLTGEVLSRHPKRHDLHHIIKVNVPEWEEPVFDKKAFRLQIEQALSELRVDRIAIVQHLHRGMLDRNLGYCAEGEPVRLTEFESVTEPLLEEFENLKSQGKVGYLATFPYTVGYAKKAVDSGSFSGVVAYFDILETEMMDLFADMKEKGMSFIGIRALAGGLLTDRRVNRSQLPEDDRMKDPEWDRLYDQLEAFRKTLPEEPESWTKFAIRFSLAHPLISSTIIGVNNIEQLHTAIDALEEKYPDENVLSNAHAICKDFRKKFGVKGNLAGVMLY